LARSQISVYKALTLNDTQGNVFICVHGTPNTFSVKRNFDDSNVTDISTETNKPLKLTTKPTTNSNRLSTFNF